MGEKEGEKEGGILNGGRKWDRREGVKEGGRETVGGRQEKEGQAD